MDHGDSCIKKNVDDCKDCFFRENNVICSADPEIWKMLEKSKVKSQFKVGQVIFYQGTTPLGLYAVSSGLVKLDYHSEEGYSHTLRYVGPGGVLGYRSLFAQEDYHATATVVEECEVCFIPKTTVMDIFKNHPETALRIMAILSKDLRIAENKWTDQMDKEASARIAEAVLFLQDNFTHQNWTRREIAEWAGTTPETVIRTLAYLEKEGYIDQSQGRNVKVIDRKALASKFLK